MIARLAFALWMAVSIVAVIISTTVLSSGAMWNAFVLAAYRKISLFVPPKYAFGGDSLTEQCGWRWRIAKKSAVCGQFGCRRSRNKTNEQISSAGVRRPEMTTDGIHFTHLACSIWIDAVRKQIAQFKQA